MSITETTETAEPGDIDAQIGNFAERLFGTGLAALEAITISLGRELGLYQHLVTEMGLTPGELADRARIDARYAREWLEQQAAAGFIEVAAEAETAEERRFALSPAAAECLLRPESLASVGPLFDLMPSLARVFPAMLVDAYRNGSGVPYAAYGIHDAEGDFNRPSFVQLLTTDWLPSVPGASERFDRKHTSVAEIGCGEGWAAISIAKAWPSIRIDGFDNDEASVAAARRNAVEAGVSDRVRFEVADVTENLADSVANSSYDVVLAFEMIHDLARPIAALETMRRLGKPDAIHLVVDEKVGERFEAATENPVERMFYAASVLHCLPVGMADSPSAATGTVMRPTTLRSYASDAGFSAVEVLPIDHDIFRFYRLVV